MEGWLPVGGERRKQEMFNEYRVLVLQFENVLEIGYITM